MSLSIRLTARERRLSGWQICLTHTLWHDLSTEIHGFLNGISLADLVAKRDVQNIAQRQDDQLLILDDNYAGERLLNLE